MLVTLNYVRSGDLSSFLSVQVTFNLREEWISTVDSGFGEFSLCALGVLCGLHLRDVVLNLRDVGLTLHDVIGIPPDVFDFRLFFREGLGTISR
jgi:hypothetical protein